MLTCVLKIENAGGYLSFFLLLFCFFFEKAYFKTLLENQPSVSVDAVYGLQREVRSSSKPKQRTPLGMQKQTSAQSPVVATSVAATVESFYRSALNAYINAHLTGSPVSKLFPDMHVQIPMRVVYINGTKGTRAWLNNNIDPRDYSAPTLVRTNTLPHRHLVE